ncbi:MAG: ornithine cyclodeaminase family protein [Acidobacteria bacterium]|nr:ornithine cyclodeaminase family protein [Acidobacteriota bacterium]
MLFLSREDIISALPMSEAIEAVRAAFIELSSGTAEVPVRTALEIQKHDGVTLVMPGYLGGMDALAIKVVSVHKSNQALGLPVIHGLVIVIDPRTGEPLAMLEGSSLTAIRTGAASGLATDLLANPDASIVAIIGAGAQARAQLTAVCSVRQIRIARIFSRSPEKTDVFIDEMRNQPGSSIEFIHAASAAEAVRDADIVCAATTSSTPVFNGSDLKPGAHINGIGSFTPQMQEVDFTTLKRASKIVVDSHAAAMEEAGDLLIAIDQGIITRNDIYAEIGEIAAGRKKGRESRDEITFFKSVGNAALDAAAAARVIAKFKWQMTNPL